MIASRHHETKLGTANEKVIPLHPEEGPWFGIYGWVPKKLEWVHTSILHYCHAACLS